MKMLFEVGDVFISDLKQTVLLCEVAKNKYKLIVTSNKEINDKDSICMAGEYWDGEEFDSIEEINKFINECDELEFYVENVTVQLKDIIRKKIK